MPLTRSDRLLLAQALRAENVSYVVAPYEADAQLAYLERRGLVSAIITEDSDLLVFGCQNVLFKMDGDGKCCEVSRDRVGFAGGIGEFRFDGWGDREFRWMAVSERMSFGERSSVTDARLSDPERLRLHRLH
jgi:exonuclease 1